MCKYCQGEAQGWANEDLLQSSFPLFNVSFGLGVAIEENELGLYLDHVDFNSTDDGALLKVKIKYCPMCGRELKGEKGNG